LETQTKPFNEHFDLNQVHLDGAVQRAWAFGADVLVRLALDGAADAQPNTVTLCLPGGCAGGEMITLLKDDRVSVSGYLVDSPYLENGQQFAERSRSDLLQTVPGLGAVTTERVSTHVVIETLRIITASNPAPVNEVIVEGVVSRLWSRGSQQFARLAVYDEHTLLDGRVGKNGRPWRKAHYVSVHFVDGNINGRSIRLEKKDRLRVHGKLGERRYRESLAMFLLRAGQIGLLANVLNADDVRETRVPRSSTYITAGSMIQFAR